VLTLLIWQLAVHIVLEAGVPLRPEPDAQEHHMLDDEQVFNEDVERKRPAEVVQASDDGAQMPEHWCRMHAEVDGSSWALIAFDRTNN